MKNVNVVMQATKKMEEKGPLMPKIPYMAYLRQHRRPIADHILLLIWFCRECIRFCREFIDFAVSLIFLCRELSLFCRGLT